MINQNGLEWVAETFGLEPRWTFEPDIAKVESIARKHLKVKENGFCQLSFYAQGAFNKLYKVETEAGCFLVRVTLPVDPFNKINSEVATINFIRQTTDIPVPQILAFDDTAENELGFEWILMTMLTGGNLRTKWRKLSQDSKQNLVKQIARYQAQLFRHKFSAIGNIFDTPESQLEKVNLSSSILSADTEETSQDSQQISPTLGQIVSMFFFWGDHITQDVPRGPFTNSKDWLRARLNLVLTDQERILQTTNDSDEIEDAQNAKILAERLLQLLPRVFPTTDPIPEPSMLFHDDLSSRNILIDDDDGTITGLVDWECVSALPLWKACAFPAFLKGRKRFEQPDRNRYAPDDEEDANEPAAADALDNEGINDLYWEHLFEYESTMLRALFLDEMQKLAPDWVKEFTNGAVKADFEAAVQHCDGGWSVRRITEWLDAFEKGEIWSFREKLIE
jgi:aminoglycoside phosphotransferase (APT) family kinase protein